MRTLSFRSGSLAAVVVALVLPLGASSILRPDPPLHPQRQPPAPSASQAAARFRGIILPDLLIVQPSGVTPKQSAGLRAIRGVRDVITFDGASISIDSRPASVIGVNPGQFRSWVPLAAASDSRLWDMLGSGGFVASARSTARLGLVTHASYQLTGRSAVQLGFGGPARLAIAGVDLVVNQAVSRKLGLVRQVAALISAPGMPLAALVARVRAALGAGARVVVLRDRGGLPLAGHVPGHIANYLQLFQASAARYCPRLSWTVLAAIGQIESADGRNVGPSTAGALGPMQFLPSTWAAWGIDGFGPAGPPDVMNPLDAVPSAARLLCADGAASGTRAGLRRAVFDYNHAIWYVNEVLALDAQYAAEYR
jgi:hypothetical protein